MENLLKPVAKNVLTPLRLRAKVTDAVIQKNIFGSGMTSLIISNEEMNNIMRIIKSLEDAGLLIKGVSETIEDEAKEQTGGFLDMSLRTLCASLLGNL